MHTDEAGCILSDSIIGLAIAKTLRALGPGLLETAIALPETRRADTSTRDGGGELSGLNWRGRCGWPIQRRVQSSAERIEIWPAAAAARQAMLWCL